MANVYLMRAWFSIIKSYENFPEHMKWLGQVPSPLMEKNNIVANEHHIFTHIHTNMI